VLTKAGFAGRCIASRRRCLRAGAHCTPGLLGCCAGTHVSHIPCFPDAGIGAPRVAQSASLARAAAARPPRAAAAPWRNIPAGSSAAVIGAHGRMHALRSRHRRRASVLPAATRGTRLHFSFYGPALTSRRPVTALHI
jgi:hypothetical protein